MDCENRVLKQVHGKQGTTHCALMAPNPALAACVRAYVTRNTMAADLTADERRNQFPPTPTCVITWVIQGHDSRANANDRTVTGCAKMPVVFSGPHTHASVSDNAGPVQLFTLLIYPDAVHALTGLDIAAHMNRSSAFSDVLDAQWQGMARAVLKASTDEFRVQLIEEFLTGRWRALRPVEPGTSRQFLDWSNGIAHRAARQDGGQSDRQVDRRIKTWTGQPLRQLRGIGRAEDSLLRAYQALDSDTLKWSDIAAASGYSDQAHLCREFRRITGFRPGDLKELISHESYWMYQVWAKIPLTA
jgi:AraC-like DNA-binding protein